MRHRLIAFLANTATGRFAESDATSFVIVFVARTGSNFLAAMLDSHPEIICHHELFNPESVHRSLSYKNTALSFGTVAERERDPWGFLRRVFRFTDGAKAVGFKMAPRDDDWVLLSLLLNRRVRKVILSRRNWLQVYTSGLIAAKTQVWSKLKEGGADQEPPVKVRVDVKAFRRYAGKRRVFYALLRALMIVTRQPHFLIDYDDISDEETLRRLTLFLGVTPGGALAARTRKQNPSRLCDRIANYQEVRGALIGTPYARMLD